MQWPYGVLAHFLESINGGPLEMAPAFNLASLSQIQGENLLKLELCCKSNLECPMFIFVNTFQQHFVCLDSMYFGQFCLTELNRTKKAFCPDLFLTIQIPSLRVSAMG